MRARDHEDRLAQLESQVAAMRPAVSRLVDRPARIGAAQKIPFIRFILREALVAGETARAEILSLDAAGANVATGVMITVFDPYQEFYGADDAGWGIAYRLPDTPDLAIVEGDATYEILRMTCPGFTPG